MSSIISPLDEQGDLTIRPKSLNDFVGQRNLKGNLRVFIDAALQRKEAMDHVIFYGPPGLGKTTLASIVALELGSNFRSTVGPLLTKIGDLAAILTNLQEKDVLFIDEIHRLNSSVEEVLYSAMEDFFIDIIMGVGPTARSVKLELPRFTLIGATTRFGLLSNPLRDRFGISLRLDFYTIEDLMLLLQRASLLLKFDIDTASCREIASRSRFTPRIALRLLRRVRDFAEVQNNDNADLGFTKYSLEHLGIDKMGLDKIDYDYMLFIAKNYLDNPVGIETISTAISEARDSIEETVEPYLIQIGFLHRTSRGRVLSKQSLDYLSACGHI